MAKEKISSEQEIEALKKRLEELQSGLDDANSKLAASAEREAYFHAPNSLIPSGRKTTISVCTNPWVKKEDDQKWEDQEVDTYLFKVDMPPVGGVQIMLNGEALQHGQTYEVTLDRARYLNEIIHRLQAHDAAIHGNDEDVWRPRVSKEINLRSGGIRNLPPNWLPGVPAR